MDSQYTAEQTTKDSPRPRSHDVKRLKYLLKDYGPELLEKALHHVYQLLQDFAQEGAHNPTVDGIQDIPLLTSDNYITEILIDHSRSDVTANLYKQLLFPYGF